MPHGSMQAEGETSPQQPAAWVVQSGRVFGEEAGYTHSFLGLKVEGESANFILHLASL